mgnify:CR=1 FL=1
MKAVYISSNNILSPLGFTSKENIDQIIKEKSGITLQNIIGKIPSYAALIINDNLNQAFQTICDIYGFNKLEKMMLLSLKDTISKASFSITAKTALIIATTKGNINVLNSKLSYIAKERVYLSELGKQIKNFFGFINEPIIVSNACVSGVLAVAVAKRLIQNEFYDNAFIVGGDLISEFTLSGFKSFQAISDQPCKPFSKYRNGITLGEAAASLAITSNNNSDETIQIIGDSSCNDANHISGPSRNGEGLYRSIQSALKEAEISAETIDYISAHGTGTQYNDEMEAVAFSRAKLNNIPVNSLKGYYGHTLGASGLLETIVAVHSMNNNKLYTSLGMDELGVSVPLNVIKKIQEKYISTILKTASGFGGCNAAIILKKINFEKKS